MYYGEANVFQDNIENFMVLAEELKLKDLAGEGNEMKDHETHTNTMIKEVSSTFNELVMKQRKKLQEDEIKYKTKLHIKANNISEQNQEFEKIMAILDANRTEISELDEQINLILVAGQNPILRKRGKKDKSLVCKVCGKEGNKTNIIDHIESLHIDGIDLPCQMCEKTFRSRHKVINHKSYNLKFF